MTIGFPSHRASHVECVSMSWCYHIDRLVQDCSNSIANALELLQSCAKPSIYMYWLFSCGVGFELSHTPCVIHWFWERFVFYFCWATHFFIINSFFHILTSQFACSTAEAYEEVGEFTKDVSTPQKKKIDIKYPLYCIIGDDGLFFLPVIQWATRVHISASLHQISSRNSHPTNVL